jgi:nucleotide-binding universal stress UspA family protein
MMFTYILVPLDGSPLAEGVLPHVIAIAKAFNSQVTLLRVLEQTATDFPPSLVDPLDWQIKKASAEAYLDKLATKLQDSGLDIQKELLEGPVAQSILSYAHDNNFDLILLSSHGESGLSGWNVSSVVQKIILRAYTSIMLVRAYHTITPDKTDLSYRKMIVPVDCSQRAEYALPVATTLARYYGSELFLAHMLCRPEMPRFIHLSQEDEELADRVLERNRQIAQQYLDHLSTRQSVDTQVLLVECENIVTELHRQVEQSGADLVILNAHGYSGGTRWPFGSVTTSFIAYGTTPLIIVQDLPLEHAELTFAEIAARERKGH